MVTLRKERIRKFGSIAQAKGKRQVYANSISAANIAKGVVKGR